MYKLHICRVVTLSSPWYNRHGWMGVKNQLSICDFEWTISRFLDELHTQRKSELNEVSLSLWIAWTVSEIIEHLLFSWLRSVWPRMKVKVHIIDKWCILMSEAITLPSLMMMALIVSEESLVRDRHRHIDSGSSILYFFKIRLWKQKAYL